MNNEHVSLQIHCNSFVPGLLRGVSDGVDHYLTLAHRRNLESATIVVTDDIDFATKAFESNDVVVLIGPQSETATREIVVTRGLTCEDVREAICIGCTNRFGLK